MEQGARGRARFPRGARVFVTRMAETPLKRLVSSRETVAARRHRNRPTVDQVAVAAMERETLRLKQLGRPLVVGPWLSEVGFETLYWIPFLRWLRDRFELDPETLTAVSRGGVGSWYAGICSSYVDIFDGVGVDDFRRFNEARWIDLRGQKQIEFTSWDARVLDGLRGRLDWEREAVLHPSLMYRLFRRFWLRQLPLAHALRHMSFERFARPEGAEIGSLSGDYVAVKFYFSKPFPETPENRAFVARTIERIAEHHPVVLLSTGVAVDEHQDFTAVAHERVLRPLEGAPPATNLHLQSVVLSRARAFVGTYGGIAYLASAYGVPAVAFSSEPEHFVPAHLEVGRLAGEALGAPLTALDVRDAEVLAPLARTSRTSMPFRSLPS